MYDRNSLNQFVQKQGGNLANLGASPSYTGAPAMRGTPPGGPNPNQMAYQGAAPQARFMQQPGGPPAANRMMTPQLNQLGAPGQVPMQQRQMPMQQRQMPAQGRPQLTPQQRQRMMMMQRQRMQNQGGLNQLGQRPPVR